MRITILPMLLSLYFFNFMYCAEKTPEPFLRLYPKKATNLHIAIAENDFCFIQYAIRTGTANPLVPDENGTTPLDIARHPMVIQTLLSSPRLETFIQIAASKGHTRIIATVFSKLNQFNPWMRTPITNYNSDKYYSYWQTDVDTRTYMLRLNHPTNK